MIIVGYSASVEDTVRGIESNNAFGDSHPTQTVSTSPSLLGYSGQDFKTKSSSRAAVEGVSSTSGSTLKNETVSRKAFALQDKVIFVSKFHAHCIYK